MGITSQTQEEQKLDNLKNGIRSLHRSFYEAAWSNRHTSLNWKNTSEAKENKWFIWTFLLSEKINLSHHHGCQNGAVPPWCWITQQSHSNLTSPSVENYIAKGTQTAKQHGTKCKCCVFVSISLLSFLQILDGQIETFLQVMKPEEKSVACCNSLGFNPMNMSRLNDAEPENSCRWTEAR